MESVVGDADPLEDYPLSLCGLSTRPYIHILSQHGSSVDAEPFSDYDDARDKGERFCDRKGWLVREIFKYDGFLRRYDPWL